jgi:hypothetical protein
MSRLCRECGTGKMVIVGSGSYDDTIEIECNNCGDYQELEPDGLGEGGLEWVEAMMLKERE